MSRKRSTTRYLTEFARRFFEALGVLAAVTGTVAVFAPDVLKDQWWLALVAFMLALAWSLFRLRERMPKLDVLENVSIRVVVGDLFDQRTSALVGMTSTFDTSVPDIISPSSVQAALMRSIFNNSQSAFDDALKAALRDFEPETTIQKPGKTDVFPIGTVAVLAGEGAIRYYCAAYTTMDSTNRATGNIRGVLDSLDSVWECADKHGNGGPICVPVIGQGQSRIPELTAEVAIRLIAFSFLLRSRRARFSSELRIVVHPSDLSKIDLREFQAFLKSVVSK